MLTRKKYYYLLPIMSLLFIAACTDTEDNTNTSTITNTQQENNSQTDTNTDLNPGVTQQLAVDPHKCIGCGKCVRFDVEHFKLVEGISIVISQENLGSKDLTTAISICPADAIELS